MHKITFEKQITAINIGILTMHANNLESLASVFQVAIRFHPGHLQPKTLVNSFVHSLRERQPCTAHLNNNGSLKQDCVDTLTLISYPKYRERIIKSEFIHK